MCLINIIHFSHHHDFYPPAETTNTNSSTSSSSSSSSSISTTSTTFNNYHLSNLTRLTAQEELISLQRLPQHHFVSCPTHTNHHCVIYKQTMPCLLQRFHSSPAAAAAAAANTTAAAEVNANANADSEEGNDGINVSTCPNLQLTNEYHTLNLLLADNTTTTTTTNNNNNTESNSIPGPIQRQPVQHQPFQTLSQAKTSLLSTADAIHQQTIKLTTHILETCSLLEPLFQKLAAVPTTQPMTLPQSHHQPGQQQQQQQQTRALFSVFREFEIPLQRASELCQAINHADAKIRELFSVFLQRRQEMADLLPVAVENKDMEGIDCGVYTVSRAKQDLRELLSTENIREVCQEPVRRGREVVREVVRVLEGVEGYAP
ncbi:hypothetical protein B0T13DRAFT_519650 [Neurospora crassa]|nr:hypothetical protein B0T13DRAFT_519650 [Neurospora crassa]